MKFNGIRHRDDTFSHFLILDDYFSEEKQLYFYNYFNNQQNKFKFYKHAPINIQSKSGEAFINLFEERFEPLEEFISYLDETKIFKGIHRFQVIRNKKIGQHIDGLPNNLEEFSWSDENLSDKSFIWNEVYWFWFRLSSDKKMFFGKNQEIEFLNRCMIFNGYDFHGSPNQPLNDSKQWSILIKGIPTQQFKDRYDLY